MAEEKKYFIVKTRDSLAIDKLAKEHEFKNWKQIPDKEMGEGDIALIYDINLTKDAKNSQWIPIVCVAEITQVESSDISLKMLYEVDYAKLKFSKEEKEIIAEMKQRHGVYELEENVESILSKLEQHPINNLVRKVCLKLNITQAELAERMGVSQNMPASWSSSSEPSQMAVKFMELLIEHEKTKRQLDKFKQGFALIDEAKNSG